MLTTFHWNALGSTLGWWFCHNNTVSCNDKFWVEQVTVPHPLGKDKGWGRMGGGGVLVTAPTRHCLRKVGGTTNQPAQEMSGATSEVKRVILENDFCAAATLSSRYCSL